jgi:hypothetical protein
MKKIALVLLVVLMAACSKENVLEVDLTGTVWRGTITRLVFNKNKARIYKESRWQVYTYDSDYILRPVNGGNVLEFRLIDAHNATLLQEGIVFDTLRMQAILGDAGHY